MVFRSGKSMRDIGNLLSYCQTNVQNSYLSIQKFSKRQEKTREHCLTIDLTILMKCALNSNTSIDDSMHNICSKNQGCNDDLQSSQTFSGVSDSYEIIFNF